MGAMKKGGAKSMRSRGRHYRSEAEVALGRVLDFAC
jgi:hypothetical protein